MPLIENSSYKAPLFFQNGHIQTLYPTMFRKVKEPGYQRERIFTPDDDFLDLDWMRQNSKKLAILSHGLEGNSHRKYIKGMACALKNSGWDVLAWNYRSCSGEPNQTLQFYHQGSTEDLGLVIDHAKSQKKYQNIVLVGFSLGGNVTLNYLAKQGKKATQSISQAVVFSVPCDIASSAVKLTLPENKIYMKRFLRYLHQKVKAKMTLFPDQIDDEGYEKIKDFKDYDDRYTAPLHGFKNAHDYWEKCSTVNKISQIEVPTLIVNALNDPMLAPESFPYQEAKKSRYVYLETPNSGGHAGFARFGERYYWSEERAVAFFEGA